jgi:cytochrome c oxidase subunit 2
MINRSIFKTIFLISTLLISSVAYAGSATNWQLSFQEAASPVMEQLERFHSLLLYVITAIVVFVFLLLVVVCVRFNRKSNPTPKNFSHNTLLEIVWTAIPVLILIVIAVPSLRILYYMETIEKPEMTLKVVGHQWYWQYEYDGNAPFAFDSYMVKDEDLKAGEKRLLHVDNRVVLPIDTNIKILATSADVIHSWAVPALAIKVDAVPGKTNQTWVRITKPGIYYGQCSELCGVGHGFMPVMIEAVPVEQYKIWLNSAQKQFGNVTRGVRTAAFSHYRPQ